ncbi:MAG: glycosyltransferase family 4 protein, partial [Methylomonas sp.]|nr:glycosyltransferase family 4 protein [Methylomonas sp.]
LYLSRRRETHRFGCPSGRTGIRVTKFSGVPAYTPYIQNITEISEISDHIIGVAAPLGSRIYQNLMESEYPHLYACDFPAKIQKELPDILTSIKTFRKIISEFKPDIVHVNGGPDLFIVTWSHPVCPPYKVIRTHHAIRNLSNDIYHKWLYRERINTNVYVCKSAFELSTTKGLIPKNSVIIENGVDLDRLKPTTKNSYLSELYGINDSCFCFGSCAGTSAYKRVDTIIDAALKLRADGFNDFKILVIGDEVSGSILERMAKERNLDNFFYCGFHKKVEPIVSLFDVGFILSDSIETISFAAREMMAMGKPLISSSFSGLKENVQDGVNGIIVEPGDIGGIAFAMKKFLEMDKKSLEMFSLNAREYAVRNFSIHKQKDKHIELYNQVIEGP